MPDNPTTTPAPPKPHHGQHQTPKTRQQIAWFTVVGAVAAWVHFLALWAVVQFADYSPAWGNVIAFCLAFMVSFSGHLLLTFRASCTRQAKYQRLIKWLLTSLLGFGVNHTLLLILMALLGEQYYLILWALATLFVAVMSFILAKYWAFR